MMIYFTININESYVAELGFELATPGSVVRRDIDCTMEFGNRWRKKALYGRQHKITATTEAEGGIFLIFLDCRSRFHSLFPLISSFT